MEAKTETEVIGGVTCEVVRQMFPDGRTRPVYTFTCPGWGKCTITGYRTAKRVIRGRTDPAVINTLGLAT